MAGIEGPIAVFRAGGRTQARGPVIVKRRQTAGRRIAMLRINLPLGGLENHRPAMNLDALLAAGGVVRRLNHGGQGIEVGRRQPGHVGLADARRIANVGTAAHLHDHHIAVGFADDPFAVGIARHAEQRIHLALTQQPGIPGVHPERPILRRRGRTGRAQNQQQRGENRRPETTGLRRFHTKTGHSVWDK
ncbi:MAG: hypothetical protein BWX68_01717 [Verrucomicrobia bacterium ADurb.Bin063]|nr:MAG: hypothetical protein BWX68_01717 [Verrucomicrobia bacterium ADurb.Bin063]